MSKKFSPEDVTENQVFLEKVMKLRGDIVELNKQIVSILNQEEPITPGMTQVCIRLCSENHLYRLFIDESGQWSDENGKIFDFPSALALAIPQEMAVTLLPAGRNLYKNRDKYKVEIEALATKNRKKLLEWLHSEMGTTIDALNHR